MIEFEEIEVDAPSLEEARQEINKKTPEGYFCSLEKVLLNGNPKIQSTGFGVTTDEAFKDANKEIPKKVEIIESKETQTTGEIFIEVEAFSEEEAEEEAEKKSGLVASANVSEVLVKGSSGFFGIGRRPTKYSMSLRVYALVEVTYKEPARILARIQQLPSKEELITYLRKLRLKTKEQWLKLDKPVQGQLAAVMIMEGAFDYLKNQVSDPFNMILNGVKKLFTKNSEIQQLGLVNLGPPNRNYDINDIPLISSQFRAALMEMEKLKELIEKDSQSV